MNHEFLAGDLFLSGHNCAQAVLVAFCDVTGLEPTVASRLSSSFGGGIGRLREVCGAVSGMVMVAGLLYGYDDPGKEDAEKKAHYQRIQELCARFREEAGSIICRELLDNPSADPNPSPRTEEYYKTRPCARYVMLAARILDEYIAEHPVQ